MNQASNSPGFHEVVTFGETMVLFAPGERDKLETAAAYHASIGGAESNCAIGLARLGHSVCWVSRVGSDPFGSRVVKTLRGESVDVSRVEVSADEPTGIMFKEPAPGNTSRVFYYRRNSAAAALRADSFAMLKTKYLFVTGITPALSDSNRALTFELVDRFRGDGAQVVFDPNMRFRLWTADQARPVFLDLAKKSDVLIPSLAEAQRMKRFYQEVLGFEVLGEFPNAALLKIAAGYAGHTQVLGLFDRAVSVDQERTTVDHIAFTIGLPDYDSERQRLETLGLNVEVKDHEWVNWRSLYFQDPEGNQIELVCYDENLSASPKKV